MFNSCAALATYSGARILHAAVVLLSVCKKRVHASKLGALFFCFFSHFVHALSHCSQRSRKRCLVDYSLGWAQVFGTSSIVNAFKQDTSRDCRRVGKSSKGMQEIQKNIPSPEKRQKCQHIDKLRTHCCNTEPPLLHFTPVQQKASASDKTSQLTSDHHSRAQMIVLNPMFRHIATENILVGLSVCELLLTETPGSITPHVCERGRPK